MRSKEFISDLQFLHTIETSKKELGDKKGAKEIKDFRIDYAKNNPNPTHVYSLGVDLEIITPSMETIADLASLVNQVMCDRNGEAIHIDHYKPTKKEYIDLNYRFGIMGLNNAFRSVAKELRDELSWEPSPGRTQLYTAKQLQEIIVRFKDRISLGGTGASLVNYGVTVDVLDTVYKALVPLDTQTTP